MNVEVIALPCVGDKHTLLHEMSQLDPTCKDVPTILSGNKKRYFAKPCKEHLEIWRRLKSETRIATWDLIYAPRAFELLLESEYMDADCEILYYHCGGSEGNSSQLDRYRYEQLIINDND